MIAVFVHIYYAHLWDEITERLKAAPFDYNLYVNLVDGHTDHINVHEHFPNATVLTSPNQGMDVGGQLRLLDDWFKYGRNEEYIIFLHSKGKPLTETAEKTKETDELRGLLWSIVSPEKYPLVKDAFKDESVGMSGVKEWHRYPGLDHGEPIPECEDYCRVLGLNNYETNNYGFIGGTMFWVRSKIFRNVFENINIINLVKELPAYANGGNIHALERIFGYCVLSDGYKIKGV